MQVEDGKLINRSKIYPGLRGGLRPVPLARPDLESGNDAEIHGIFQDLCSFTPLKHLSHRGRGRVGVKPCGQRISLFFWVTRGIFLIKPYVNFPDERLQGSREALPWVSHRFYPPRSGIFPVHFSGIVKIQGPRLFHSFMPPGMSEFMGPLNWL